MKHNIFIAHALTIHKGLRVESTIFPAKIKITSGQIVCA